ncbi:hypothetical protein OROMI_028745 [Orobanche minor]
MKESRAFSALGKKDEALSVWEQGYDHAVCQSSDLKLLLELEDLLRVAKQNGSLSCQDHVMESTELSFPASRSAVSTKSSKISGNLGESNGKSKPRDTSINQFEAHGKIQNGSSLNFKEDSVLCSHSNKNHENHSTESNGAHNKLGGQSVANGSFKSSNCSSVVYCESSDSSDICNELFSLSELHHELMHGANRSKKFCVGRISKKKSINVDFRLSRGIAQIVISNLALAEDGALFLGRLMMENIIMLYPFLTRILQEEPDYAEALIGRGTAYAFQRELHAAIADFSKVIHANPSAGEAWKRRGQARAALGESAKAIADLTKALEFVPNSADILHERGIVSFKFKDYKAAVKDLSACVDIDQDNKSAYTYLGLALSSLGEYRRAEEAHMEAIQIDQNFLEAWTHLAQFYQDMADSEKALQCIHRALKIDGRFAKAYHLRGLLFQGMGDHRNAIKELSVGLGIDSSSIESLYLRASCYHAIGEFKEAVKDYDAALDLELDSVEKFAIQCLAFYQKEIALYTASKFNAEFSWFDLDGDIDPLFKEYWCKRLHPKNVCEKVYRQPPLRESLRKGKLKKLDFSLTKQKAALLQAADSIGKKIQYHCPGFLPNRRQYYFSLLWRALCELIAHLFLNMDQYRMAGLAAIEIAQKVVRVWRSLQTEWKHSCKGGSKHGKKARRKERLNAPSQNRGGAGCSTSSLLEPSISYSAAEDRPYGRPTMPWNGVYSVAIKWRQISEPSDAVVWLNKLSEDYNSGFGSLTLLTGQTKITLNVAKAVIKDSKYVRDTKGNVINLHENGKLQEIVNAESCSDFYRAVGEDFWLATWCNSMAVEGDQIGYDFAIKTPYTLSRWENFEVEMTSAWEALCNAYCGENYGSTDFDVLENVRKAILRMTYYWYNFMPLTRGTAVIGFVVLLGLCLAANMEFTGSIPEGVQLDWEAILEPDPNSFISSVKSWLYPSLKINTSWKAYPDVASTLETTGLVVAALSTYVD